MFRNFAILIIITLCFAGNSHSQGPRKDKVDGIAVEKELIKSGTGSRVSIEISNDLLSKKTKLKATDFSGAISFNPHLVWMGTPFYFRQITGLGQFKYPVMITGANKERTYFEFVIPIGPGTVYEVYGNVEVFGVKISADRFSPLVFVVYSPEGSPPDTKLVNPVPDGWGTAVTSDPIIDSLFLQSGRIHHSLESRPSNEGERRYFLVHTAGSGTLTLSNGTTVSISQR